MEDNRANADQLRHRIDRGHGADKVNFPDPAAAPLGTDDEAAGTPVTPGQAARAMADETRGPAGPRETTLSQRIPSNWRFAAGLAVLGLVIVLGVLLLQ